MEAYTLFTTEIDDIPLAVEEIRGQLVRCALKTNTVGIIVCHHDFVLGGCVAALQKALPFPLVGFTTFYQAVPGARGLFELSVTVLTADDVRFGVACDHTGQAAEPARRLEHTYGRALAACGGPPSLILNFLSVKRPITGDEYLRQLDRCSGGVPAFGGVATGDTEVGDNVYVICGGAAFSEGFAMLLLAGAVDAEFFCGSFKEEKLLRMRATVTRAEGATVYALNGQPAAQFLRENGVDLSDGSRAGLCTIPFVYNLPGQPAMLARTLVDYGEDGRAIFFGEIPEGAIFRMGTSGIQDIVDVSAATAKSAAQRSAGATVALMFSCIGRFIALGLDTARELDAAVAAAPEGLPHLASYVGGEICPVSIAGHRHNRYHNSSFVVCVLR